MQDPVVIIGSGLAAYTTLRELRKLSPTETITLITSEAGDFYSKPMLSTAFANAKNASELITTPKEKMMEQLNFSLQSNTRVLEIHPSQHTLKIETGDQVGELKYSKLILALGADPIRLNLEGNGATDILSVNDLSDYAIFRQKLPSGGKVAILGAGLIGCEFANDLTTGGYQVEVIDLAPTPLGRLLPPELAEGLRQKLAAIGVQWHLATSTTHVEKQSNGTYTLSFSQGAPITVDLVLSAVGLHPRTELAQAAGLQTDRGIIVNRMLQTSDPDIFALGDCIEVEKLILPYVMPIMQAAKIVAANVLGESKMLSYPAMPVMVKTPAFPLIIAPPAIGAAGNWEVTQTPDGMSAKFTNANQELLGFALAGSATKERAALTPLLPAILA
jgi:rubredoxin---NAD+ reductase